MAWIEPRDTPPPLARAPMNRPTSTGVRKMPATLDRVALHTAAGVLPRAMEVKAMED